ncbi:hypothetical protein LCGC14_0491910 [marine sediment metagenome]|uniref:phosphoribosylanthranilate isomerase n=1 Tax=marine sediment metagenome TaxID=412755 RepID=A0A0F9UT87_9ZZZZ|nr:MAG: N-(5'-phosphoribosyl)anthranilate isomerase [Candidatus Lokiarchaeum sp. GC14_75]
MMEYVKICGLKKYDHVQLCIEHGADAVGFIYNIPSSPRNMKKLELTTLLKLIKTKISTVIVLKPSNVQELKELINTLDATYFQIHPDFDNSEFEKLSKKLKKKIILAFTVNQANKESVIKFINSFRNQFFAFLIDNSEGEGNKLDLNIIQEILKNNLKTRIIVAGGITIENIEEIVNVLEPYGIDISSSLEMKKGVKDPERIKNFLIKINELKIK